MASGTGQGTGNLPLHQFRSKLGGAALCPKPHASQILQQSPLPPASYTGRHIPPASRWGNDRRVQTVSTTSVFALTRANGGSTVGALLAPSDLLISASSTQIGPSDVPGSSFTTSVAQIGQKFTLADGNTGTVIDVSSDQTTTGNYALLHLASPESATPLALSSAPVSNGQAALVSNGTSSYTTTIGGYYSLSAHAPDGTGPDYQGVFLSPDGGTLLGLGTSDEYDRGGHTISGPAISSNSTALATIRQWLAADTAAPAQPPAPQNVAVHDNTTGTDLPDTSSAYTGPVSGVSSQLIAITPDNLNITAKADNLFIKTGAGNDAIALHGGTNVVDAGSGSNFLTGAAGFDTFFLDARNIPAQTSAAGSVPGAIWDTLEQFGAGGDAVTLWGVGRAAALSWQTNQGAVGHTGLTLHANKANGTEASITFAGIDSRAGLSLSYGNSGGVDYLYVKAI